MSLATVASLMPASSSTLCSRERHSVSELLEAVEVVAGQAVGGQAIEVIGAEIAVGAARAQDVVRRDEDAVARRDGRLLLAAAVPQAGVLGTEIRSAAAAR